MRLFLVSVVASGMTVGGCAARTPATHSAHRKAEPAVERTAERSVPARAASPETQEADASDGVIHIVQAGQTLWRIARAYDIDLGRLAEANGIDDPARVDVGTPLLVPGARATIVVAPYPAPPPSARTGETDRPAPAADFLWPVAGGTFMRPFGEPRRRHKHAGVDIRGTHGQDILAARDGVVAFCGGTKTGYGTMVVLDHGSGIQTLYAHAEKTLVKQGQAVSQGQPIAHVGRSGNATTEHCHFELRLENRAVDPMPYILGATEAHR